MTILEGISIRKYKNHDLLTSSDQHFSKHVERRIASLLDN